MKRGFTAIAAACALAAAVPATAGAKTLTVDNDLAQCPKAQYEFIQDAVDDAAAGDTIIVCDGVYEEPVHITTDRLKLRAKVVKGAVIQVPQGIDSIPDASGPIVHVDGAKGVEVRRFVIAAPYLADDCSDALIGVLVNNGGDALIRENLIEDIRPAFSSPIFDGPFTSALPPCGLPLAGVGVAVGDLSGVPSGPPTTSLKVSAAAVPASATARVQKNDIRGYGTIGVLYGPGTRGQASDNKIDGLSNSAIGLFTTQFGVALINADVDVTNNTITRAGGIPFVFGFVPSGIGILGQTEPALIKGNKISNTQGFGIGIGFSTKLNVDRNVLRDSDFAGVSVDATTDANVFNRNDARSNGEIDCIDGSIGGRTAGTANTWTKNRGFSADPSSICTPNG